MKFEIETARHQHLVKNERQLQAKHASKIAKKVADGHSARIHDVSEPLVAHINQGVWVGLCDCGAGMALDPEFSSAYCFGCGAIYSNVSWPSVEDRLHIEQTLLARPKTANRNWDVGETVADLIAENVSHGIGGA